MARLRKGQVFIITLVFLVALIFTMQVLLGNYSKLELSKAPVRADSNVLDNIEQIFQRALSSGENCPESQENFNYLKNMVEGRFFQGSEVFIQGNLTCNGQDFIGPPDLDFTARLRTGENIEIWKRYELSRIPTAFCTSCAECQAAIYASEPGSYVLLRSDIQSEGVDCLNLFGIKNITIDCRGHSITGTGRTGGDGIIINYGSENMVIRNCPLFDNLNTGIDLNSSLNNTIKNVYIADSWIGINFRRGASDNNIINSTLENNNWGMVFDNGNERNTIRDNFILNTNFESIRFFGSPANRDNRFFNNYISGSPIHVLIPASHSNYWNTTLNCTGEPNIIGGNCMGGNYWSGFSNTGSCVDLDSNGICDNRYTINPQNHDYLPLKS